MIAQAWKIGTQQREMAMRHKRVLLTAAAVLATAMLFNAPIGA
jgi:hypothetical protein